MSEILRYIDSIARDKQIDPEGLIVAIENAVAQALAKKYGIDDLVIELDRDTGEWNTNYEIDLEQEGRILATTVRQSITSRLREQERDVLFNEYEQKLGEIVIGTVRRIEGEALFIDLGRNMEGILPRSERVRGENYNVGDRIRCMVFEVKTAGNRVKVILSRAHRDFVRALFELEVPEIADGLIQIRRIEREPGYRTKLAVDSSDEKVDCVGACVGVRGSRIKSIVDELNGERIDIIPWSPDPEVLIVNALNPAEISHIELDDSNKKALVLVDEDQLSLAIGRRGQNVRLASKLTNWEIDIMTRSELEQSLAEEESAAAGAEGVDGGAAVGEHSASEPGNDAGPTAAADATADTGPIVPETTDGASAPDSDGDSASGSATADPTAADGTAEAAAPEVDDSENRTDPA